MSVTWRSVLSGVLSMAALAACSQAVDDGGDTEPDEATRDDLARSPEARPTERSSANVASTGEDRSDAGVPGPPKPTCGGPDGELPRCVTGHACEVASDCASGVCARTCAAPTPTDGVKNGDESDVDCGGVDAPSCANGKACSEHSDCTSDACNYEGKCVAGRSCTAHYGGDTCGAGEVGDPKAKHVSCCETAPLFGRLSKVKLDRFLITAGRMRAFIERTKGDVRSYVRTLPATKWKPTWNDRLVPSNMAEADVQLGSYFNKKSCHPGDHTGRTYWTPNKDGDYSDFSKDVLDTKALNCVTWELVAAFCAWDGGRMVSSEELRNAFTGGGKYTQPWLFRPGAVRYVQAEAGSGPDSPAPMFNHAFSYGFPKVAGMRLDSKGKPGRDIAYFIAAPGRHPSSWNENGHEIAGNLLTWNDKGPSFLTMNYSWENHGGDHLGDSNWANFQKTDMGLGYGYYAIGGRCARD